MLLSIAMVTYNVEYLDYSLESSIRCGMDLADEICVNDGGSTDGTYDVLLSLQREYGKDRLKLDRRQWFHDFYWEERERNHSFNMCSGDWIFVLDTDECLHENSIPKIRELAETLPKETVCIRFPITNFYGTKDFVHPSLSCKDHHMVFLARHAKIGRRANNFRVEAMPHGNCAELFADFDHGSHQLHGCTRMAPSQKLVPHNRLSKFSSREERFVPSNIPRVYDTNEQIFHYSYARDARAQSIKQMKANSFIVYEKQDSSFFEGYLPQYTQSYYTYKMDAPCVIPFTGQHPKYMQSWFDKKERLLSWNPEG